MNKYAIMLLCEINRKNTALFKVERGNKMKEEKKKVKGQAGKIIGRIVAALMIVFMLVASCSTFIYYLVNNG